MNRLRKIWMSMLLLACGMMVNAQTTTEDVDVKYAAELLKPGTVAPDFVVSGPQGGKKVSLKSLRGQYVVLDFWASWCPDCRKDIPAMKAMYEQYSGKQVQFISVSFDTDKKAWTNCIAKNDMKWLQHSELKKWKKGTKIDRDYHVNWIPTYYLLDKEGKVLLGTVQHEKIGKMLADLTGGHGGKKCGANCKCGKDKKCSTHKEGDACCEKKHEAAAEGAGKCCAGKHQGMNENGGKSCGKHGQALSEGEGGKCAGQAQQCSGQTHQCSKGEKQCAGKHEAAADKKSNCCKETAEPVSKNNKKIIHPHCNFARLAHVL